MPKNAHPWIHLVLAFALLAAPLAAQPPAPGDAKAAAEKTQDKKPAPEEKSSRTQHSITLNGQTIPYTATAGTILLKAEDGTPRATVFSISYTRDGVKDPGTRPVTFSFNGGPGSASVWVHMGAFGPKRVERDVEGMSMKPPGRLVDNDLSILDETDLVFIDPVDTGYSRTVPGQDAKQFHGVRQDVESVGEIIRLWVTRNQRWASPKFIAGESYGTTRAAGRDLDAAGESFEFDPSMASLGGPYVAALNDYLRRELKFEDDQVYEFSSRKVRPWDYGEFGNQYLTWPSPCAWPWCAIRT